MRSGECWLDLTPTKHAMIKHSYRGALPDYPLGLEGVGSQVTVAQRRRTGWELLILEESTSLKAPLLQDLIVLVQIPDRLPIGAQPLRGCSVLAQPCCHPGHVCQAGLPPSVSAGQEEDDGSRSQAGVELELGLPQGRRLKKCKYVPEASRQPACAAGGMGTGLCDCSMVCLKACGLPANF